MQEAKGPINVTCNGARAVVKERDEGLWMIRWREASGWGSLAVFALKFGETTNVVGHKYLTAIKVSARLVLKQDGTVMDAFVLASQQLVYNALREKKLTPEQVAAMYAAGAVPLTAPTANVPADGAAVQYAPAPLINPPPRACLRQAALSKGESCLFVPRRCSSMLGSAVIFTHGL